MAARLGGGARPAWRVPTGWEGETAFLLGGGPSLAALDPERLRGRRVIGINEAGLTVAPWCEVLLWIDTRWLCWNVDRLALHTGRWKVARQDPFLRPVEIDAETLARVPAAVAANDVRVLTRERRVPLSADPTTLAGACGGGAAINYAVLAGARRIGLLGYDMRPIGQFHDRHRKASTASRYASHFIPAITRMAPRLAALGVEVFNLTPGSGLTCFPFAALEDLL